MKDNSFPFWIGVCVGIFIITVYILASAIIALDHRVSVLEDQMETTMNILTEDGMK